MPAFFQPLRYARFRRLWLSQLASSVGDSAFAVAMVGIILNERRAADLGSALASEGVALAVVTLFAGVWVDRSSRARVMAVSDTLRLTAVLGFLIAPSDLPLWLLMTLAAMMGAGAALFRPAFGALVPSLVPPEAIPAANALRSAALQFSAVIGPAAGGILLATHGADSVLLFNVATFLVSILTLIGTKDPRPVRPPSRNAWQEARAGFGEVRARPWALAMMALGSVHALVVIGPLLFLLPDLLRKGGHFASYGPLIALQASGALAGGILAARWTPRNAGTAVICANAAAGLQLACLAYAAPVPLIGLAAFATGAGYAFGGVVWISTLQRNVPNETLGRVLSLDTLSGYALMPLGVAVAPVVVSTLGSRTFLLAALTALLTATALPLFFRDVRTMGRSTP